MLSQSVPRCHLCSLWSVDFLRVCVMCPAWGCTPYTFMAPEHTQKGCWPKPRAESMHGEGGQQTELSAVWRLVCRVPAVLQLHFGDLCPGDCSRPCRLSVGILEAVYPETTDLLLSRGPGEVTGCSSSFSDTLSSSSASTAAWRCTRSSVSASDGISSDQR